MSNLSSKSWNFKRLEVAPLLGRIDIDDVGCKPTTLERAEAKLAESGLTLADARATGIFPCDDARSIHPDFAAAPALVIPYLDAAGDYSAFERQGIQVPFCRVRYLPAPGHPAPKERRYDQAGASGTRPYFPRADFWAQAAAGALEAVAVVEGELKAAALCNAGIPAVAIGGVDCFGDGSAALHPALANLARQVADVYVVFDSDAAEKPRVQAAEWRFANQLALVGGRPHIVRLPPGDAGAKMGADDYLVANGAIALVDLINAAPALGERAPALLEAFSLSALLSREVQPVCELIADWLEKDIVTFLCGPGGVHKSRWALQIGLCLNAGVLPPGLGGTARIPIERGPIATLVYVSAEDDDNELARRVQAISKVLKLKRPKHDNGVFLPRKGKDSALVVMRENGEPELRPFYHELMHRLRSIPGHKLLVLDSAYDFARWQGHTKVNEDAVNWFVKVFLQGICDQAGCTLLIPWHPSAAGQERGDMSGWSVGWVNAPRARLSLGPAKNEIDAFELAVAKRNHGRRPEPITLRFHEGALLPIEHVPDDGRAALLQDEVVKLALDAARMRVPFNKRDRIASGVLSDVAKAMGRRVSPQDFRDALEAAARAGKLQYVGYSRHRAAGYYPPDRAEAHDLANAAKRAAKERDDA